MIDIAKKEQIIRSIESKIISQFGRSLESATKMQIYLACSQTVRDDVMEKLMTSRKKELDQKAKKIYYLSVEFLQGRALGNNLLSLQHSDEYEAALLELGVSLDELEELEPDPGLGNGGLGRLASCFLDSLATLNYPAMGCGIRYEYGLFRQKIIDGSQVELPDAWLKDCGNSYPWEVMVSEDEVEVRFNGYMKETWSDDGKLVTEHMDYTPVMAVPYDMPIVGYGTDNIARLRLWSAKSVSNIDYDMIANGEFTKAIEQKELSEMISKVLYPCESHIEGKSLRLKQHYFFTSATMQYIIKNYKRNYGNDLKKLSERVAIQINDTHPALAIPELMRILLDVEGYDWDDAWEIICSVFNYTNHTVLVEALEKWPEGLFKRLVPRIYQIVYEINERYCRKLSGFYSADSGKIAKMAIVAYGEIRMANLCIAASGRVNGVSGLHGDILKRDVFNDFYVVEPWKFLGITNGITPRRWLMHANPDLSSLIDETIGDKWRTDIIELSRLEDFSTDRAFMDKFTQVKRSNKVRLSNFLNKQQGTLIDPDSMFDVQAKRMHEYKRQMLNIFNIIYLYDKLMNDKDYEMQPTTFILGAKAAANYNIAKSMIRLVNAISVKLANAPAYIREKLNVVFMENYNVSKAELLIPAANISEQISTAGKEASGTGNMKFMMNGALTIGTLDGANVEMYEQLGDENIFLFGLKADETQEIYRSASYAAGKLYESNAVVRHLMNYLISDEFAIFHKQNFSDLHHNLLFGENGSMADPYLVLKDFGSYALVHKKVEEAYKKKDSFTTKAIMNTARSYVFSSDRTIEEYNDKIWHLEKLR